MNTTSFLDKQIMDLSQGSSQQNDFIGLMNHPQEVEQQVGYGNGLSKKDKILSNYFQSISPIIGSSFQSPNIDAKHNLGGGGEGSTRAWNSSESKSNTTSPIRVINLPQNLTLYLSLSIQLPASAGVKCFNYGSLDSIKPSELILEKDQNVPDATIVSEIDRTMKKHVDSLLHVLEGVSEKLTQLESRTHHLENSVDDLKISVGNNHGNTDGKMRQLENVLRDVQTGIQVLKDKQAIVETQLQLGKTQVSNSKVDTQSQVSGQTVASESTQARQQPPHPVNLPSSLPAVSPPNAPPQPMFQSVLPLVPPPNQFSQNQIPPVPQRDPYFPAPGQTQEAPNQQYQLPPSQQSLPPPTAAPHQQFQPTTQPQHSQPPPQLPQQHPSLAPVNPSQLRPTLGHHAEEAPYVPSLSYPPNLPQPPYQTPSGLSPSQQYYGPGSHAYEPPSSKSSTGFSSGYGPASALGETYHYGGSLQDDSSSMKPRMPSSATAHSGGIGYPQLPVARVLPHASPASSRVGGSSGSAGTGNKVPIDDVIDHVTTMGFPRDHVRATIRKLTDNGQAVDVNVVLDKLMNDGEVQPPRGWFGR
ncbi:unnamed protein product [Prunus armeniaca]|uniref:DUF1421 domain-containing protein n=1 Tax=Prunus armeniaca TaxID=36596 RepID=A0A6J5WF10_PRUAR|nr:unnamed protein product [Prunus armeniaca]